MRKTSSVFVSLVALVSTLLSHGGAKASPDAAVFQIGAAVRDITPTAAQGFPDGVGIWLGGYGLGATGRRSTGVEKPIKVRGMVVTNAAGESLIFGINETQGMFTKYQQGLYGLEDMRREISKRTGVPMEHIVLGSDHSHQAPDTSGVWGGVPDVYLQYIFDQQVGAVMDAWNSRVASTLHVGTTDAPETYSGDTWTAPEQDITDTVINVLQAKAVSDGSTVMTFMEVPYHPTNGSGASKTTISPSWPGDVSDLATETYGGVGFGWQGDIGRQYGKGTSTYWPAIQRAIAASEPVTSDTIAGDVKIMTEPVTNPVYLYFISLSRPVSTVTCTQPATGTLCNPIPRQNTPPYSGVVTGGFYGSTFRIGDIVISAGGGEVYPNIQKGVVSRVGASHHFYLGLAQDQVGYIIAPTTSWALIVPQAGDNGLFNASPTLGDHLMCTHLNSAAGLGFTVADIPAFCPALTASDQEEGLLP